MNCGTCFLFYLSKSSSGLPGSHITENKYETTTLHRTPVQTHSSLWLQQLSESTRRPFINPEQCPGSENNNLLHPHPFISPACPPGRKMCKLRILIVATPAISTLPIAGAPVSKILWLKGKAFHHRSRQNWQAGPTLAKCPLKHFSVFYLQTK